MKARLLLFFLLCLMMAFFPSKAPCDSFGYGLSDEAGLKLLKGEKKFKLLFNTNEDVSEFQKGLIAKIRDNINIKLKIMDLEPGDDWVWGEPYLLITLLVLPQDNQLYSGYIELSFDDEAIFFKDATIGYAPVWTDNLVFNSASEDRIRGFVDKMFSNFLNRYLEANPRKDRNE